MLHLGHSPGASEVTSGCIGHAYTSPAGCGVALGLGFTGGGAADAAGAATEDGADGCGGGDGRSAGGSLATAVLCAGPGAGAGAGSARRSQATNVMRSEINRHTFAVTGAPFGYCAVGTREGGDHYSVAAGFCTAMDG